MPKSPKYPLSPPVIAQDRLTIKSLKNLDGYNPHSPEHSVAALIALDENLGQAEDELHNLRLAFEAGRNKVLAASQVLHDTVLGAKAEVIAQFGPDSHAVAAIGLVRKSQRKRPSRRSTTSTS